MNTLKYTSLRRLSRWGIGLALGTALLCAHLQPGGDLVLAGILERQADELKDAYAPWCALEVAASAEGWILMTARRAE